MFKTDLALVALTPDLWYLASDLVWVSNGLTITAPHGFVTDLASIPRALRNLPLTDVDGISRRPAALHDWLYAGHRSTGKNFADATLREALKVEGMSAAGAAVYYYAVHWFGGHAWESDGRKLEQLDFHKPADYQAWKATGPVVNPT